MAMTRSNRPRVGVALGGGAARGWAHLGVLRVLEQEGIRPHAVAGTSIGSFVAAAWLSGSLDRLTEEVLGLDFRRLVPFLRMHLPRAGLVDGRSLEPLIRRFVTAETFADLPVPCGFNATDLREGEEVFLRDGDLLSAILASTAVPGLFSPVTRDGHLLIDGGIVNPVPVSLARQLGAEVVIAVDINHHIVRDGPWQPRTTGQAHEDLPVEGPLEETSEPGNGPPWPRWLRRWFPTRRHPEGDLPRPWRPGLREVLLMGIAIGEVTIGNLRLQLDPPEVLIRPRVGQIPFLDFSRGEEAIEAGSRAAREVLSDPATRRLLGLATPGAFGVPSSP